MPSASLVYSFPVPLGRRGTAAAVAICVHVLLGAALITGLMVQLPIPVTLLPNPVHPPPRQDPPVERVSLTGPDWNIHLVLPPTDPGVPLPQLPGNAVTQVEPAPPIARADGQGPVATTGPRLLHSDEPPYPAAARRLGEQGVVVVRVLVGIDGTVARAEVATSSGSPRLDNAALASVRRWRFAPASSGSGPIESWTSLRVVFRLTD
ncbi:MAG TPA: TonB family protein [Steroidobacteraceae bacterium]|nr:TonB family protein [Steroidobacteraceae bacterium]